MTALDHSRLMAGACTLLADGGTVMVTGVASHARSVLLRQLSLHLTETGVPVDMVTVDSTTTSSTMSILCDVPADRRPRVVALDGLDHTDPVPALLATDDGLALLAGCSGADADTALDRLVTATTRAGVSPHSARRLVSTHIDLILVVADHGDIHTAYTVHDGHPIPLTPTDTVTGQTTDLPRRTQ